MKKTLSLAIIALALGFGTAQASDHVNSTITHQSGNDHGTVKTTTNSITGSAAAGSEAYGNCSGVISFAGSAVLTGGIDHNSIAGLGAVAGTAAIATGDRGTGSRASSGANASLVSSRSVDQNHYSNHYTFDEKVYAPTVDVTPSK